MTSNVYKKLKLENVILAIKKYYRPGISQTLNSIGWYDTAVFESDPEILQTESNIS